MKVNKIQLQKIIENYIKKRLTQYKHTYGFLEESTWWRTQLKNADMTIYCRIKTIQGYTSVIILPFM
jgi:hypothetical protein